MRNKAALLVWGMALAGFLSPIVWSANSSVWPPVLPEPTHTVLLLSTCFAPFFGLGLGFVLMGMPSAGTSTRRWPLYLGMLACLLVIVVTWLYILEQTS